MKNTRPLFAFLVLALAFSSCKKDKHTPLPVNKGIELSLSSDELQQASADNTFTFSLFKEVAGENTNGANLFVSPLSVSMALGMTSNGANGETLKAIDSTLNFTGFSQDAINSYYNKLVTELPKLDPNTTLKISNSIWYDQKFSVLPQFIQTDSTYFHAAVQPLDFTSKSAVTTINNWVSDQTNGKIKQLLNSIQPSEVMYLVNAIYFKSTWLTKFDPSKTQKMAFNIVGNSPVQADFMQGKVKFNTLLQDNVRIVELPYSNSKYSMVIVMPVSGDKLSDVVANLNSAQWQTWMSNLRSDDSMVLQMPKFQFSYGVTLNDALKALGMSIAFGDAADFTRINANGMLSISQVKHKAYIAVDEEGTEAAAATSVGIQPTDAPEPLTIDHPFLFVIREMKTGLILFAGTVNNPLQSGL